MKDNRSSMEWAHPNQSKVDRVWDQMEKEMTYNVSIEWRECFKWKWFGIRDKLRSIRELKWKQLESEKLFVQSKESKCETNGYKPWEAYGLYDNWMELLCICGSKWRQRSESWVWIQIGMDSIELNRIRLGLLLRGLFAWVEYWNWTGWNVVEVGFITTFYVILRI